MSCCVGKIRIEPLRRRKACFPSKGRKADFQLYFMYWCDAAAKSGVGGVARRAVGPHAIWLLWPTPAHESLCILRPLGLCVGCHFVFLVIEECADQKVKLIQIQYESKLFNENDNEAL